ncbi:MAG: site-2 protease family protein, partial [Peptostreptococcaceae bacterium]
MKKLKYYKYITYTIIAFIFILLSYLFGYTVSYLMESLIGYSKIGAHIITFCTIFLLTYYVAVAVHELTHFIVFRINKIEMRGLIIGPFIFIKTNDKWRFKFKVTKIFFAGGIAIPDIDIIENNEGFNNFRRSFAKALIA